MLRAAAVLEPDCLHAPLSPSIGPLQALPLTPSSVDGSTNGALQHLAKIDVKYKLSQAPQYSTTTPDSAAASIYPVRKAGNRPAVKAGGKASTATRY
ncbi:hypothetical protein L7F22_018800 [Adiantum nelumboides]|nr:hypothetical protein [Adiantum nelumboides]